MLQSVPSAYPDTKIIVCGRKSLVTTKNEQVKQMLIGLERDLGISKASPLNDEDDGSSGCMIDTSLLVVGLRSADSYQKFVAQK